jgi:hypothetical protein
MNKWVKLIETNDKYEINCYGDIRNAKSKKIRKNFISSKYFYFTCIVNEKMKGFLVHRLVGKYFVNGYKHGLEINHKDLNKLNNHYLNLEWISKSENIKHRYSNLGSESVSVSIKEWHKNNDHKGGRLVLNVSTGIFYPSVKHAAVSVNKSREWLKAYLNGKIKTKNTDFIYA